MPQPKLSPASTCLSLIMAVCSFSAFGQPSPLATGAVAMNTAPAKTVYFRNDVLGDIRRTPQPFSTDVVGSVQGRVLHDEYSLSAVERHGVGGVRVILRSIAGGVHAIAGHRITDANGKYDFANLPPGNYSVEADPLSVPARVRTSGIVVSPMPFEASPPPAVDISATEKRTIKGIVYIDKDGNGLYEPGKDATVSGAYVTANGRFARSEANGAYLLKDMPSGRTAVLVSLSRSNDNTHVVLELGSAPVINRIVNVAVSP